MQTKQRRQFHLSLIEDTGQLARLWEIDQQVYPGAPAIPLDEFGQWWRRYDHGLKVIADKQNAIHAGLGVWALPESQARAFIGGQITEADLQPIRIETLMVNPSRFWYVSGVFSLRRGTLDNPLKKLLSCGISSWMYSNHVRYPAYAFALGFSAEGIELLNRFKFELVKSAEEMPDGQPLYSRLITEPMELRELLN